MKYILLLVLLVVSCHPAMASQQNDKRLIDAARKAAAVTCLDSDNFTGCMSMFNKAFTDFYLESFEKDDK